MLDTQPSRRECASRLHPVDDEAHLRPRWIARRVVPPQLVQVGLTHVEARPSSLCIDDEDTRYCVLHTQERVAELHDEDAGKVHAASVAPLSRKYTTGTPPASDPLLPGPGVPLER